MSDLPRLFVPDRLAEGAAISGSPGQAHYLGTVMRRAPGDAVRLFNAEDGEWLARITALRKERAIFTAETRLRAPAAEPDLWLVFAPLKRDATDLVVQKATELGASVLLPVFTERTNTGRVNLDRLALIATEAAEQCERLSVPRLVPPEPLESLLAGWPADRRLAVAMERAEAPPPSPGAGALLVGPEGGFAPGELDWMRTRPFVVPVSLGPRILRAETAAIVGLALLQAQGPF
jgi:16S rRNA (uracil1498-N3)-methyltransferase